MSLLHQLGMSREQRKSDNTMATSFVNVVLSGLAYQIVLPPKSWQENTVTGLQKSHWFLLRI